MEKVRMIIWLIGLAFVLIFTVQNLDPVEVKFLAWTVKMSQAILVVLLIVMGFSGGWLVARFRQSRKK